MENATHQGLSGGRIETDPSPTRLPFGRTLKRFRLAAGLSQEALAERAGVSPRTISDLERGIKQGPRGSTLRLLVDALALGTEERAALWLSAAPPDDVTAEPVVLPSAPVEMPTNLPLPLTSFVGRERELATVRRLLGETRLLTLTGAGGCGKTRLALEVARALAREGGDTAAYADGIHLVELAALSDGTLVPRALATVLGVREQPGQALFDTLTDFLRPKQTLLLLDNCEHLVEACARVADGLLRICPYLTILTTSREALRIDGEQPWRVPSFDLPAPLARLTLDQTLARDAVRLFVQRAQVARPDFALTVQNMALVTLICRRLDGMPLAIELAAARLSALALDQLAARLDDRFRLLTGGSRTALPRQETLRATLDWSYDLLDEAERLLLRRLSVFAGGWTLEAAELVCAGAGMPAEELLDRLAGLVAKSLVLPAEGKTEPRYWLLETVRQYGQEKLAATDEVGTVRARHLDWCLTLAGQAASKMGGPEQEKWLERLEEELESLRAALAWSSIEKSLTETGLRLAAELRWFWVVRGGLSEGQQWLEDLSRGDIAAAVHARALDALAELVWQQADYKRALALFEESFVLHEQAGNGASAAHALLAQGMVTTSLGDYPRATALIEEALPLLQTHGERHGVAWSLASLGVILHLRGELDQAARRYQESLVLFQEVGDRWGSGEQIANLAEVALDQRDFGRAKQLYYESLILRRSLADKSGLAGCFVGIGRVAAAEGRPTRATRLLGAAYNLREALGISMGPANKAIHDRTVAELRATLGVDAFAAEWAAGQVMPLGEAVALALEDGPNDEAVACSTE